MHCSRIAGICLLDLLYSNSKKNFVLLLHIHAYCINAYRRILVRLESMAGTGETIDYVRQRIAPKVVLLRFDRKGLLPFDVPIV